MYPLARSETGWSGRDAAIKIEMELISEFGGMDPSQFRFRDVMIDDKEHLHALEIGAESGLPKLLMIHGFGGNNTVFYKMFATMSRRFHIFSIDLPGMGFNFREFDRSLFETLDEAIEFVVTRIRLFVEAVGWTRFSLLGHSMGSFFGGHFFDAYEHMIEKLILLSPAGFNRSSSQSHEKLKQAMMALTWWQRAIYNYHAQRIFSEKKSPWEITPEFFIDFAMKFYFAQPRLGFSKSEQKKMIELSRLNIFQPQCGERCLGLLFDWGLQTTEPLSEVFVRHRERQSDVAILYGEKDWMDFEETLETMRHLQLSKLSVFEVKSADHQLMFQNPKLTMEIIFSFIDGGDERADAAKFILKSKKKEPLGLKVPSSSET